eukprot:Opistho-2@44759
MENKSDGPRRPSFSRSMIRQRLMRSQAVCCAACKSTLAGNVIEFGNSLFHPVCFKCGRCGDLIEDFGSQVMLANGLPACMTCTPNCAACGALVDETSVLLNDRHYHVLCLSCDTCGARPTAEAGQEVLVASTPGTTYTCASCLTAKGLPGGTSGVHITLTRTPSQPNIRPLSREHSLKGSSANGAAVGSPLASNAVEGETSADRSTDRMPSAGVTVATGGDVVAGKLNEDESRGQVAQAGVAPRQSQTRRISACGLDDEPVSPQEELDLVRMELADVKRNFTALVKSVKEYISAQAKAPGTPTEGNALNRSFSSGDTEDSLQSSESIETLRKQLFSERRTAEVMRTEVEKLKRRGSDIGSIASLDLVNRSDEIDRLKKEIAELKEESLRTKKELVDTKEALQLEAHKRALAENTVMRLTSEAGDLRKQLHSSLEDLRMYRNAASSAASESSANAPVRKSSEPSTRRQASLMAMHTSMSMDESVLRQPDETYSKSTKKTDKHPTHPSGHDHSDAHAPPTLMSRKSFTDAKQGRSSPITTIRKLSRMMTGFASGGAGSTVNVDAAGDEHGGLPVGHARSNSLSPNLKRKAGTAVDPRLSDGQDVIQGTSPPDDSGLLGVPHRFKLYSALKPSRCAYCGGLTWGGSKKALKCKGCGISCHSKCTQFVPPACGLRFARSTDALNDTSVITAADGLFGVELSLLIAQEMGLLPEVLTACVSYIEEKGLKTVGIYRMPADQSAVDRLKVQFCISLAVRTGRPMPVVGSPRSPRNAHGSDNESDGASSDSQRERNNSNISNSSINANSGNTGSSNNVNAVNGTANTGSVTKLAIEGASSQQPSFEIPKGPSAVTIDAMPTDPHVTSACLLQFLMQLPNPLLTFELYDRFIGTEAVKNDRDRLEAVTQLLKTLPASHFKATRFVMEHLCRVARKSRSNKMSAEKLAAVFAPVILRPHSYGMAMATLLDSASQAKVVENLITNCARIFDMRVAALHWGVTFSNLLADADGVHLFRLFLRREYSEENIDFWLACERYARTQDELARLEMAAKIYKTHLRPGCASEVNVDSHSREFARIAIEKGDPNEAMFVPAQSLVYELMRADGYMRFLRSAEYVALIEV